MTNRKIIDTAIADAGITIPDAYGLKSIIEAQDENATLYDTACKEKSTPIQATSIEDDDWYSLPADCIRIKYVYDSDHVKYEDYTASSTQIRFDDEDTYTIDYLAKPADVTLVTETPESHVLYHTAIAHYLVYKALEGKKPDESNTAYARFISMSEKVDSRLKRMKRKNRTPSPPFR